VARPFVHQGRNRTATAALPSPKERAETRSRPRRCGQDAWFAPDGANPGRSGDTFASALRRARNCRLRVLSWRIERASLGRGVYVGTIRANGV